MARKKQHPRTTGEKIQTFREQRGYSIQELGRRIGLSGQTVSNMESANRRDPSWRVVQLIALALEVSTEDLRDETIELPKRIATVRKRGRPRKTCDTD